MKPYVNAPDILYCDNHLLALHKPGEMVTQPTPTSSSSLEEWGKEWLKERFDKKGNVFLEAVHRLDRPVSGVVLFARTTKAASRMQEKVRDHIFKKIYLAEVEGHLDVTEGTFEDTLLHDSFQAREHGKGKWACLHYQVLERRKETSLVAVELVTGRYHQIRFQFSKRGHPIVGDRKYGSRQPQETIALHHLRLETEHPVTHLPLVLSSPVTTLPWCRGSEAFVSHLEGGSLPRSGGQRPHALDTRET